MTNTEDVIVVDDEPAQTTAGSSAVSASANANAGADPSTFYSAPAKTIAESVLRSRRRGTPGQLKQTIISGGPKVQPKLKLKLSEKAAAMASGSSFLGAYDRELDSDEEDLVFEEQFILRMPHGDDCERLRKVVASREGGQDVWMKFKDSRRAVFHIGNSLYSAKLVDLPCIVESQKTLDNKQMFKVADICQMLVVENKIPSEEVVTSQKNVNIDEFIWPHGVTPPLHHVRKRRFRKRVNRRTIETVEQEVERLLEADAEASQVKYDILENVNPDLSDSEFIEREDAIDAPTPGIHGSDIGDGDAPTPALGAEDADDDKDEEDLGDGEIDEDLAAELDLALGDDGEDGDEEDEDDEDGSEDDEDDEDEDDEAVQAKRLLNDEIKDLEAAVAKKQAEIASSANPLIRRRFEDALKKLRADLEVKLLQRDDLTEQQRMRKEGIPAQRGFSEPNDDDGMDVD